MENIRPRPQQPSEAPAKRPEGGRGLSATKLSLINEIRSNFSLPKISDHLNEVEENLIRNIDLFKIQKKEEKEKEHT